MAQIRKTTYVCDSCEATFDRKGAIRKFYVQSRVGDWSELGGDLCLDCEEKFLSFVGEMFGDASELRRTPSK